MTERSPFYSRSILWIVLVSLLGGFLLGYATASGPWAYSDSTAYLTIARSLLEGRGLGMPDPSGAFQASVMTPPLYPLALSGLGRLGIPLLDAARWMNVVMFVAICMGSGWVLWRLTHSLLTALGVEVMLCVSPALCTAFTGAMSEALSMALGMGGLLLVLVYLRNPQWKYLIGAALLGGLAFLTRYIALSYALAALAALLFLFPRPWKQRFLSAMFYASMAAIPAGSWLVWFLLRSNVPANRGFHLSGDLWAGVIGFRALLADVLWPWIPYVPPVWQVSYRVKLLVLLGIAGLALALPLVGMWLNFAQRKSRGEADRDAAWIDAGFQWALILDAFILAYILILLFSVLFAVPTPDVNERMLSPVNFAIGGALFVPGLTLAAALHRQKKRWASNGLTFIALAGLAVWVWNVAPQTFTLLQAYHTDPPGYTSLAWRHSPTLAAVQQIPSTVPIVSNESALILFYTGRPAYDISELLDQQPHRLDVRYGDDLQDTSQKVFREGAALVIFDSIHYPMQLLYQENASRRLEAMLRGLYVYQQSQEGAIYFYQPPAWKK